MKSIILHEAKTELSKLLEQLLQGEEVIICKEGKPVAKLIAFQQQRTPRKGGEWAGTTFIPQELDMLSEDCDTSFIH